MAVTAAPELIAIKASCSGGTQSLQMVTNDDNVGMLSGIADLLAPDGANPFRARACHNGSRTVRRMDGEMAGIELADLPPGGVGPDDAVTTKTVGELMAWMKAALARAMELEVANAG